MKTNTKQQFRGALIALTSLALVAGIDSTRAQVNFSDNFEGKALDPFWSTSAQSGSVVFPGTTRAHGGSQSVEIVSTSSALDKWMFLYHQFQAPTYGTVSVWVYDTGADLPSSNGIGLQVTSGVALVARIGTYDFDLGPGDNGSTYAYQLPDGHSRYTGIDRTQAWHQFTICSWSNAVTVMVDGNLVYTGPGGQPFDRLDMTLSGPAGRPAWSVQFDDFQFVSQPSQPGVDIHTFAGLTITGSVNAPYEVQYKTGLESTNWQSLALVTLPASPYYFFDTSSPSASQRYYRVVAKP